MPYFRSLSDDELQTLHPLLKNLNEQSTEIVEHWHQLYTTQFGESRTLLQEERFIRAVRSVPATIHKISNRHPGD